MQEPLFYHFYGQIQMNIDDSSLSYVKAVLMPQYVLELWSNVNLIQLQPLVYKSLGFELS